MDRARSTDDQLLQNVDRDPDGFGVFYRRHERVVLGFFVRATGRADLAVDLAAETFARAYRSRAGFDPTRGPARAWLFGIARHVLAGSLQRGRVEAEARRRLGMEAIVLDDRTLSAVEAAAAYCDDEIVEQWLDLLPADQRGAVRARVIDDRAYAEIASELECSEAVVRQRVSRGLSLLRRHLEGLA
ncbi:MAG: hypothetical protein QOC55_42 [Thermoleophilaceae bacterium]|jgi:RNA polymerase sigma factor (sigma-70 family)|nr:hypothetical protein [Thermoleophilaceae bacterium]